MAQSRLQLPQDIGAYGTEMAQEELKMGELQAPYHAAPMQSTVINIRSEPHMPDHVVWSLFNSRDRKMVDDMIGDQSHATTAKCLNIFSMVLALLGILVSVILLTTAQG
ncbi:interferon-induced transmembrane protein 3-like [Tenrec ecaudatus]|uniref:interferon-induced transmembrane protein 3-like n=1 Tax=Tenrec ecaudatus TaxID=94439 RepID=UPI003F5A59C3